MTLATAQWLCFSQDDNVFDVSAFTSMWFAICETNPPRPIIFRVNTWQAGPVWIARELREENIDADCIVCPNDPKKLGVWGDRYNGDADFILGTGALYDNNVAWNPAVKLDM
jgi:hypothetical protein